MGYQEQTIEGRNAVIEAYRSGKPIEKLYIQDGCQDGPVMTIKREARKHETPVKYVERERLDQMSETGRHQGVIAVAGAYEYAELEDILQAAREKGEPPFLFLLDNIEDPHNLGAIIRTANLAGAHGVIIPKNRAVGLTATVARTSAGALNYTPVARVTNLSQTIEELKKAAYEKTDEYHTGYLMNIPETQQNSMLGIGLNYIRFAVKEPNLFRFLFQSGFVVEKSLLEMVNAEELIPVISAMQKEMNMNMEQTKEVFIILAMFVHGYASIIANNSLEYDEKHITTYLERVYTGAVLAMQEEKK